MKKSGRYLFETGVKWAEDTNGYLHSRAITTPLKVTSPKKTKEINGTMWTPEHLLIGAVSSGVMTTFLFYAKQKDLPVTGFECETIGQVELMNNQFAFTKIDVYPKIMIETQQWADKAKEVIELTKQHCIISKALLTNIFYHPSIEINATPITTQ